MNKILFAVFVCLIFSCNPEKALMRKEDRALGIVEGSVRVFPIAGATWLKIHPCIVTQPRPDSIVTRIDTIIQKNQVYVPYKITEFKHRVIDTIVDNISIYADSNGIVVKNMNEAVVKTNTIYKTIVDQTLVNNQADTINSLRVQKENLTGQITANDIANKEQHDSDRKEKAKWIWLFVGLAVVSVASHIIRSYV